MSSNDAESPQGSGGARFETRGTLTEGETPTSSLQTFCMDGVFVVSIL
ncbi:hypothetical protein N9A45_01745 [bacterium]|nr:hypothetical protein [bacterium]